MAQRVLERLTPEQKRIIAHCNSQYGKAKPAVPTAIDPEAVKQYLLHYNATPYEVNRRQNEFIRKQADREKPDLIESALHLNFLVESMANPSTEDPPTPQTHRTIRGKDYLIHGDILPGTQFKLGKPETYSRELLVIKKDSKNTLKFTREARMLAVAGKTDREIADALLKRLNAKRTQNALMPAAGEFIGAGTAIFNNEEWCRHKSAMLTICLQEAGVRGWYTRGNFGASRHAWVEPEMEGRDWIADAQMGTGILMTRSQYEDRIKQFEGILPRHVAEPHRNEIWRPIAVR